MMRLFATLFLLLFAAITMSTPTYATPADVSDTYGAEYVYEKATGEVGTLDVADAEAPATRKVQAALDKAANRINAAVQRRYGELPFTEHALLSDLNAEGAWYELWSTSRAGMDEETARLHKVWLKTVDDVGTGALDLGPLPDDSADADPYGGEFFEGNPRLFSRRC